MALVRVEVQGVNKVRVFAKDRTVLHTFTRSPFYAQLKTFDSVFHCFAEARIAFHINKRLLQPQHEMQMLSCVGYAQMCLW